MQLHTYDEFEIWNLEQNVCSLSSHLLNNKNYSFQTSHLAHIFLHTVDLRKNTSFTLQYAIWVDKIQTRNHNVCN